MKKTICLVLVAAMLLASLAGCGGKKDVGPTSSIPSGAKPPKTGPVGQWTIPIPEVNPLGTQSLYSSTTYEDGGITVKYIENFAEKQKDVYGETWTLEVEDTSGVPLHFLREYAASIKASVFSSQYGDRLSFTLKKDAESLWWADAQQSHTGYTLRVVKERHVPVGKETRFSLAHLPEDAEFITFVTTSTGQRFQSATVKVATGNLHLEATDYLTTGVLQKRISYSQVLMTEKATTFVLDDIPQGEGSLTWKITWENDQKPPEVTFLLKEVADLPPVKQGEALGALKVCGVPFGSVEVEPQKSFELYHADGYSLEGYLTPEGDTLFWLPAGLWNVVLGDSSAGLDNSKARLVPVSSGEMTVLTLPTSLKSAYLALNSLYADPENLTGGIEIVEATDLGTTASVSLLVNDPKKRDVFPTKENTIITEGGKPVEITSITRQVTPPSVVLVLDSSGSMGNQMPATLAAARAFVSGLPDKSYVRIIDFDSTVRPLNGETRDAVIKSLSSVTAGGSTKLFDATLAGLELLRGRPRPALVVFADGADSSLDGQGIGSDATQEDVVEALGEAGIPVYTIGFGNKPDERALREFSAASGGQYYSAKDNKALPDVFMAISTKFGNSFVMNYNRPKEAAISEIPVVTFVMDASGSMDIDPAEEPGCGYRMEKTKALFHDFILKLPASTLMQMVSFQTYPLGGNLIKLQQMTTSDKGKLLQGLGELQAGGGTPTLDAIRISFEHLRAVPSSKRVLVYLTDAALDVEEEEQEELAQLLKQIKENGVLTLWAGMGVQDSVAAFEKAAELSGGKYVVSEDALGLEATLLELLTSMQAAKPAQGLPLSISIADKAASGEMLSYAANTTVNFTPPKKSSTVLAPEELKVVTGTPLKQYDAATAAMVTGTGVPGLDTVITKRIPFAVRANNEAMELKVSEAVYLSKLKGLEAPYGKQFLALQLNLKNVTKNKIQYLLPSIHSHFYVNINNSGSYPASDATWLAATPISPPGDPEVSVFPGQDLTGMVVFVVPEVPVTQTSLHVYDTSHGHVNLPLVGRMDKQLPQIDRLPTTAPQQITDAFSITLTGTSLTDKVDIYEAEENTLFRLVEANFHSKVQALLDIDPKQRLWLKTETANGPLLTPMSDVTSAMPFGFIAPVKLAPGSHNTVRFAYPTAKGLANAKADIWADVQSGSLVLPLVKGNPYGKASAKPALTGDGFKLKINQISTLQAVEGFHDLWVVADVTFSDTKDGFGTIIPEDFFQLVNKNKPAAGQLTAGGAGMGNFGSLAPDGVLLPSETKLLYGINGEWAVFDGTGRRGLLLFVLPEPGREQWLLRSPYVAALNEPISSTAYNSPELLVYTKELEIIDPEFEVKLAELVRKEVLSYQNSKATAGAKQTITLDRGVNRNSIPMPTIVTSGVNRLNAVTDLSSFTATMQGLRFIPSPDEVWEYRYAPEAVLTQGFGTEWDLANLALRLAAKIGLVPKQRMLTLTAKGIEQLKALSKLEEVPQAVPGVWYVNPAGQTKLFVIPFMKDISELEGLVYLSKEQRIQEPAALNATIQVSAKVVSTEGSAQTNLSDAGAALGGGETQGEHYDYVPLLSKSISLPALSLDAVDIGYMEAGSGKGKRYTAVISTSQGMERGTGVVDTGLQQLAGIKIEVQLRSDPLVHESTLKEGETPDRLYHSLAINLPDLPDGAVKALENATDREHKAAKDPDALSTLKWYGRNIINRLIATQTTFDNDKGVAMKLVLGRTDRTRMVVLTSRMGTDNKMRSTIDLVQAINQVHNGDKTARAAYNIAAGLFASSLEAAALTGTSKAGYLELWASVPRDASMLMIFDDEHRGAMLTEMEQGSYPTRLLDTIRDTKYVIIAPDKPAQHDGEKRWAWLQIDPETFETISVVDTGERAGMASYAMSLLPSTDDCGQYIVGAFIGLDVAVWSVCSSALKLSEYKEILADAKATAEAIGKHVNEVMDARSKAMDPNVSWGVSGGGASLKVTASPKGIKAGIGQNVVGFSQGFNDAIKFYFAIAGK